MRQFAIHLLAVVAVPGFAAWAAVSADPVVLPLDVLPGRLDLGRILAEEPVYQSLAIHNPGPEPVRLREIAADCADCLTYELEADTVPAGESVLLHLVYQPPPVEGPTATTLALVSDDPSQPVRAVQITAEVVSGFAVDGGPVVFDRMAPGETRAWRLRIRSRIALPAPFTQVLSHRAGLSGIVTYDPENDAHWLDVQAGPDLAEGINDGILELRGNDPTTPRCRIPVSAYRVPAFYVTPNRLLLHPTNREQLRILFIQQYLAPPARITRIAVPDDRFRTEIFADSQLSYERVNVYAYGLHGATGLVGNVVLETTHMDHARIEIPVYVYSARGVYTESACESQTRFRPAHRAGGRVP
jgi:hypothetical protein